MSKEEKGKLVLLLGAGASIEFFKKRKIGSDYYDLSTNSITKLISDIRFFIDFLRKIFYESSPDIITSNTNLLKKMDPPLDRDTFNINAIKLYSDILYSVKNTGNYNFEDILYLTDKICSLILFGDNSSSMPAYANILRFFDQKTFFPPEFSVIARFLPYILRNFILYYIYLFKNYKDISLWRQFLKLSTRNYSSVSIYSTNYDLLLYNVLKNINDNRFSDGFDAQPTKDYNFFYFDQKMFLEKEFVYVPLHGSLLFGYDDKNCLIVKVKEHCLKNNLFELKKHCYLERNQDKSLNFNINMITGYDKIDTMLIEPYSTYYLRFCIDLMQASEIIVMGFSGYDNHICSILRSVIRRNATSNNHNYLIVGKSEQEISDHRCVDFHIDSGDPSHLNILVEGELRCFYNCGTKNFLCKKCLEWSKKEN